MGYMFYNAGAFDQLLSFDTSSVTNMGQMFGVRSSPCPAPTGCSRALPSTLRAPRSSAAFLLPSHYAPHRMPPFRLSAERKLLVRRQQAAHSSRVGGHPGLRLCWLCLKLGFALASAAHAAATIAAAAHAAAAHSAAANAAAAHAAAALRLQEHGRPEDGGPGVQR